MEDIRQMIQERVQAAIAIAMRETEDEVHFQTLKLKDYIAKYPTWDIPNVVEGSVAPVIDDPTRLIGGKP